MNGPNDRTRLSEASKVVRSSEIGEANAFQIQPHAESQSSGSSLTRSETKTETETERTNYKLTGKAKWNWYKFLITEQAGSCVVFLLCFPAAVALMSWALFGNAHTPQSQLECQQVLTAVVLAALPAVVGAAACWLWLAKNHLRRCQSVTLTDSGLILESWKSSTKINWHELDDAFAVQEREYALKTRQGDFYFSTEMEGAADLFQKISLHLPDKPNYDLTLCEREGYRAEVAMAAFAVTFALLFPFLKSALVQLLCPTQAAKAAPITAAAMAVTIVTLIAIAGLLHLFWQRTPRCIRIGRDGVLIIDSDGRRHYDWLSIKAVKKLLGAVGVPVVHTPSTWYMIPWFAYFELKAPRAKKSRTSLREQNRALQKQFAEITRQNMTSKNL